MLKDNRSPLARRLLAVLALLCAGTIYGYFSAVNNWPPANFLRYVRASFETVAESFRRPPFLDNETEIREPIISLEPQRLADGLVLVAGIGADRNHFIQVLERDGTIVQEWRPNWFEIWPDADEYPFQDAKRPIQVPGAVLHGLVIQDDGSVTFNFEFLSTVKLNACGQVLWRLANNGHHSLDLQADGSVWASAMTFPENGEPTVPNYPRYHEIYTAQHIARDGTILKEVDVLAAIRDAGLLGLLLMRPSDNTSTAVRGSDTLHMNDVEVFPADWDSEFFEPGDLLISLRNVNTILVLDPDTGAIKFRATGNFVRQHDPDFAPGDKITVFDNNNLVPGVPKDERRSRILEIDVKTGETTPLLQGPEAETFFSSVLGKHQRLRNGNWMVVSPVEGRAIELSPEGKLLWQYANLVDDGYAGFLTEAHVLPESMDRNFFAKKRTECAN